MENTSSPLDKFAKNLFEDFSADPENDTWEQIQEHLEMQELDDTFRTELLDLEVTPSPEVWTDVQKKIPVLPWLRIDYSALAKVAAVLLVGLSISLLVLKKEENKPIAQAVESIKEPTEVTFKEAVEQATNLEKKQEQTPSKRVRFYKKSRKSEAEILLSALLTDDDEFPDSLLNLKKLQRILQPIEPLPVLTATATIGINAPLNALPLLKPKIKKRAADLQISIPLIVVEADEIDGLIRLYDKNN